MLGSTYVLSRCCFDYGASAAGSARFPARAGLCLERCATVEGLFRQPLRPRGTPPRQGSIWWRHRYFFNEVAYQESRRLGLDVQFIAEISDDEIPRRRTVVVGMPESKAGG